jgi:broad specificity phosphatase PhoE
MPTVLLVRHAQASYGANDYDVLSELGHRQAAVLAEDLRRRGIVPDRIVTGALRRQRDTVAALAPLFPHVAIQEDGGWDEYDSHDILTHHSGSGARLDGEDAGAGRITSRDFQALLDGALTDWISAGAGGPATEPWPAFAARVRGALERVADGLTSGQTALVCSSGGAIGHVCAALLGMPATGLVTFTRGAVNTGVTRVVTGGRGATLVTFNEQAHLDVDGGALRTYR